MAVDITIDVLFWLDIVMTFFVGFKRDRSLQTEYNSKEIATRYLKCWFWIDFIAALPIDRIMNSVTGNNVFIRLLINECF